MTRRRPWLAGFAALALLHLVLLALATPTPAAMTKLLLVPVLLAMVIVQKAPKSIWVWLALCWLGDLLLLWAATFALGMLAFGLAHVALIAYFMTRNAWARLKANPWVPAAFLVAGTVLVPFVVTGLDDLVLQIAMPVYAFLLIAMASLAWSFNQTAGLGGLSFLVSDSLIALGVAERISDRPAVQVVEMALYAAALALLTLGVLRRQSMRAIG